MLQVGHNALGAGQVIDQGARLVDKAVQVQPCSVAWTADWHNARTLKQRACCIGIDV